MLETHMQTKKLDWILKGDFVPPAYTCNNREVGSSQGFFLSLSNFSEPHLLWGLSLFILMQIVGFVMIEALLCQASYPLFRIIVGICV